MIEHLIKLSDNRKFDPWEAKQSIAEIRVLLHCSRYWMLSEWECENMSFPFWRLYHSSTGGSFITYNKIEYELNNTKLVLIPPYTSFSTHIKQHSIAEEESIIGKVIKTTTEVDYFKEKGMCDQLFVHFNLGFPYDKIKIGIYEIEINEYWLRQINLIKINRLEFPNNINTHSAIEINCLIMYALQGINLDHWDFPVIDKRILKVISYIDKNIDKELTNNTLSKIANLATNSFARLFKLSLNCTVKNYIQQRRIEHAIMILHHSNKDIEDIALECGYYDRHHFSRVFKQQTGIPPAKYRLKIGM
jgi:AraC-like DNA-binding protein